MKKEIILSLVALFALCSCKKDNGETKKTYTFDSTKEATYEVADTYPISLRQIKGAEKWNPMISVGNPKMLVIPVDFSDSTCDILQKGCEGTRSDIQAAFFGTEQDTVIEGQDPDGWESVKSYYYESSYGKLTIDGVVTPWYRASRTAEAYTAMSTSAASSILLEAVSWYKQYCEENELPFDFDADQDGYIDCVQMIYSVSDRYGGSETWWAYTSALRGSIANLESPEPYQYVFASQSFMYHDTHYIDAHTYIHETGHVLGLEDYYNTSDNPALSRPNPAGKVDMMDNNVGDHCAYSKFAMQWITPKIVTGEGSITIRPMTTTGDAIIVSPQWNGTAFDEYLIIEYHRPIGLNQKDSQRQYAEAYPLVMTDNGIKVYHIDSRLLYVDAMSYEPIEYTTTFKQDAFNTTILAHSNTPDNSGEYDNRLVHLLESSGKNTFFNGGTATNETLFKEGDTFGAKEGLFDTFEFHSGKELPFVFEITSITDEEAVITFAAK